MLQGGSGGERWALFEGSEFVLEILEITEGEGLTEEFFDGWSEVVKGSDCRQRRPLTVEAAGCCEEHRRADSV